MPQSGRRGRRRYGKVGLACLSRAASLVVCSVVAPGACRLAALWLSKQEWQLVIMSVAMVCFVGSEQLLCSGPAVEGHSWDGLTAEQSWLQYPSCVAPSSQSKRERDLKTGCVYPASGRRRRQNQAAYESWVQESGQGEASVGSRRLSYWTNADGYAYVEFNLLGVLALEEGVGQWTSRSTVYTKSVRQGSQDRAFKSAGVAASAGGGGGGGGS